MKPISFLLALLTQLLIAHSPSVSGADEKSPQDNTILFHVEGDIKTWQELGTQNGKIATAIGKPGLHALRGVYVGIPPSRKIENRSLDSPEAWLLKFSVPETLPDVSLSLNKHPCRNRSILIHPGQTLRDPSWAWRSVGSRAVTHNLLFNRNPRTSMAKPNYVFGATDEARWPISLRDPANLVFTSQILLSRNMCGGLTDEYGKVSISGFPDDAECMMQLILPGLDRSEYEIEAAHLRFDSKWRFQLPSVNSDTNKYRIQIRKKTQ